MSLRLARLAAALAVSVTTRTGKLRNLLISVPPSAARFESRERSAEEVGWTITLTRSDPRPSLTFFRMSLESFPWGSSAELRSAFVWVWVTNNAKNRRERRPLQRIGRKNLVMYYSERHSRQVSIRSNDDWG